MIPKLLKTKREYILLRDFNLHHPFWRGVAITSTDNIADDFIHTTKAASLSLAIKIGIETWAKSTLTSTLNLMFISL